MPAKRPAARRAPPKAQAPSPAPTIVSAEAPGATVRYRVLSSGISTPAGAVYRGAIVTAASLGDETRVDALLDRGAIEEVADGAD